MEHVIGFAGTIMVLLAYLLLSVKKISAESLGYQGLNFVGAVLLIIYAVILSAWASLLLNGVWALIALFALVKVVLALKDRYSRVG